MSSLKISAFTAEHIGDRAEQQDRVAIVTSPRHPHSLLAIVSDGMGGRTGGRMAADQVITTASNLFRDVGERDAGSLRGLLKLVADEAHTVIRLSAISTEKEPHATFVGLIVCRDRAIWAHAGDSRLYHFRRGSLRHRTQDQTYAWYLRSQGRELQALDAEKRFKHMLVSALGLNRPPDVAFGEEVELQADDCFLLCSDGLWAYFSDAELGDLLHRLSPRDAGAELVRLARERAEGRGDNLSLAIVKFEAQSKS
jgi:serine/threonine protein phosphatase PrpC